MLLARTMTAAMRVGEGADDEVSFVPLSMGCAEAALLEFLKVSVEGCSVKGCILCDCKLKAAEGADGDYDSSDEGASFFQLVSVAA
jgi:hypothetical protein